MATILRRRPHFGSQQRLNRTGNVNPKSNERVSRFDKFLEESTTAAATNPSESLS